MSEKNIDIKKIIEICKYAGDSILEIYNKDYKIEKKSDNSPITDADRAANEIIEKRLLQEYPTIPIISEESKLEDFSKRKDWEMFWLVDPIDGTKDFIKKSGEFTINIALIKNREPILGVVFAPALDLLYFAEKGKGAFKKEGKDLVRLPIKKDLNSPLQACISRSHPCEQTSNFIKSIEDEFGKVENVSVGSSLKFCFLAEGKIDLYPRLVNLKEWDIAASAAILLESKMRFVDFDHRKPILFNSADLCAPRFLACKKTLEI